MGRAPKVGILRGVKTLSLLFGLRDPVDRRTYAGWGFSLALLKFGLDTAIVQGLTGKTWSPLSYAVPSLVLRRADVGSAPEAMQVLLPLVAIPFLWIGLGMSVRRSIHAGLSPWFGTLFIVPLINYVAIAVLCLVPARTVRAAAAPELGAYRTWPLVDAPPSGVPIPPGLRAALGGVAASMVVGVSMVWLCVGALGAYGVTLFVVTPFVMGATCGVMFNKPVRRSVGATIGVALASVALTGTSLLLFGLEGGVCLLMAAPIASIIAILGALIGRSDSVANHVPNATAAFMLALPFAAFGESRVAAPSLREVTTVIDVDAPPERVWPNVIGFSDIAEPPQWFFELGVAYPKRARIVGEGVGAVRRCEFSTGAFVEPITAWQPPSRLAFDVTAQPPSMTEWSPFHAIHPPHLEGYLVSRGGEFVLEALPGGRTRLRGTTRYTLAVYPEIYWVPFAEAILHAIHRRVLVHIREASEAR
jgi:hypothetical protein